MFDISNESSRITTLNVESETFLQNPYAGVYWKDKKGVYLGFNKFLLDATDLLAEELAGSNDFELSWKAYASKMTKNDSEVIYTGKPKIAFEFGKIKNETKLFLSHKIPLRSRLGKVIGVYGESLPIDGKKTISEWLTEIKQPLCILLFNKVFSEPVSLSPQEFACACYVATGFSNKQIARKLNISPRTVETHLDNAKIKFHVKNVKQFITCFIWSLS